MQTKFQLKQLFLKSALYFILSVCFPENFWKIQNSFFVEHMWIAASNIIIYKKKLNMPSRCCYCLPSLKKATMMKEFIPTIVKLEKENLAGKVLNVFGQFISAFLDLAFLTSNRIWKIAILAVLVLCNTASWFT